MHIVATDQDARAMACATENFARLEVTAGIDLQQTDMFPAGRANLVVCNPPWLPGAPECACRIRGLRRKQPHAAGVPGGIAGPRCWRAAKAGSIISDLAERLGLRSATMLADAIGAAGLVVLGRCDAHPQHGKALDAQDALRRAGSREVTTLWRLGVGTCGAAHVRRLPLDALVFCEDAMRALFHLAFHVRDLNEARAFYGTVLGCREGRSTDTWVDFDFFSHQISLHLGRALPHHQHRQGRRAHGAHAALGCDPADGRPGTPWQTA